MPVLTQKMELPTDDLLLDREGKSFFRNRFKEVKKVYL
jgi:hypothetical protein